MWRRFGLGQAPAIGAPTLFDTTMDDRYLETIPEVESIISRQNSVRHSALPELPFRSVQPTPFYDRGSSVYSDLEPEPELIQPSPTIPDHVQQDTKDHVEAVQRNASIRSEVSSLTPRSSSDNDSQTSPLVSPVSTQFSEHDRTQQPNQDYTFRSQPPGIVQSAKIGNSTNDTSSGWRKSPPVQATDKKQETRWDDFSGEPTDSDAGKPAAVRPGAPPPLELQYPQLKERTKQILAGLRDRDPAKKQTWTMPSSVPDTQDRHMLQVSATDHRHKAGREGPETKHGSEVSPRTVDVPDEPVPTKPLQKQGLRRPIPPVDSLDQPVQREPWKGASGRTALVPPVKNTPNARLVPLHIPRKEIPQTYATSNTGGAKNQSPSLDRPVHTIRAVVSSDSIKPVVPLKLGSNTNKVISPISPVTAEQTNNLQSPFQSPQATFLSAVYESVTTPTAPTARLVESPADNDSPLTPTTPTQSNPLVHQPRTDNLLVREPPEVEASRFSWTTYATTETGSPTQPYFDGSPTPPVPMMPSPVALRKRGFPSHADPTPFTNLHAITSSTTVLIRKPVPAADRNRAASMMSSATSGKALPQCPPELEAQDKISTLEARLDDLARRKRNINKIVKELNEAMRRNAIAYDAKKRKEIEKMVTNLNLERDEITQEEHEVGLRLHRAQRKRDKEDNYEQPTGLWIKRVTS